MKIAVTGARGGIGTALLRFLETGEHEGIAFPTRKELDLTEGTDGIRSWIAAYAPSAIVHLAAPSRTLTDREMYGQTLAATRNVLESVLLEGQVCRLVMASSAAVYGDQPTMPIPISAPLRGRTVYASAKIAQENLARLYRSEFGLDAKIARIFNVVDLPADTDSVVPALRLRLSRHLPGEDFKVLNGNHIRDFVLSTDIARALALLCASDDAPVISNVATGSGAKIIDVARHIAAELNVHPKFHTEHDQKALSIEVSVGDPTELSRHGWSAKNPFA